MKAIFALVLLMFITVNAHADERCADLTGRMFVGADGQGGDPAPGCEGCGNDGSIMFDSATQATVNWVGSDVLEDCKYAVRYPTVTFTCQYTPVEKMTINKSCTKLSAKNGVKFAIPAARRP